MMPTALVYQAAMVSGYDDISVAEVPDAHCWLCAGPTHGWGRLVKDVVSHTFNDPDFARGGGQSICAACVFCLKHKPFRTRSVLATRTELRHPLRTEWRDILVSPPEPPWVGTIAVSGHKHLVFKTRVNVSNEAPWIAVEETLTQFRPEQLRVDVEQIEQALATFSKMEVRTGRYQSARIRRMGLDRFEALSSRLDELRLSRRRFDLALLLARKLEARANAV